MPRFAHKNWIIFAGAAPLLLALGGLAAPGASSLRPALLAPTRGALVAGTNATDTDFAGWTFQKASSVTAEFKVPALTCSSSGERGVAPMVAMLTGPASNEKLNVAGILMLCDNGTPFEQPLLGVNSDVTTSGHALAVGDELKVTITTSASATTATVADLTKGHSFVLTASGKGAAAVEAYIIDDSVRTPSGTQLPLYDFGTLSFTSCAVGGKPIGSVPGQAFNMETSTRVLQILTGPITGAQKNAFLTTWKHA